MKPLSVEDGTPRVSKIAAFWRAFKGYCPRCNSDAPAIDTCEVCFGWRGNFPPENWRTGLWLMHHFEPKEGWQKL